jgi:hypothetical protein
VDSAGICVAGKGDPAAESIFLIVGGIVRFVLAFFARKLEKELLAS